MRRVALSCLLLAISLQAQSEHPISGRRIAPVMGVGGVEWMERSEREMQEMPETALDAIGIKP
ncbi:MAG TPA: SAM-dependent methyltransferase, partial [Bryobacteraceae bacterium]|nr:SAM-dependent methyltransferase [Bryobacteraceae bacterium]